MGKAFATLKQQTRDKLAISKDAVSKVSPLAAINPCNLGGRDAAANKKDRSRDVSGCRRDSHLD